MLNKYKQLLPNSISITQYFIGNQQYVFNNIPDSYCSVYKYKNK